MEERTKRPKLKLKTSPRLLELAKEFYLKSQKLKTITDNYNKFKNKPGTKEFKKAFDAYKNKSSLEQESESLRIQLNREKFKVSLGEDLEAVECDAFADGDKNACLKLLRWNIKYLENDRLRAILYQAYKNNESQFLDEVAYIIKTPKKPHGHVDMETYDLICGIYDPSKTKKELLNELDKKLEKEISFKRLKRMGL